MHIDPKKYQHIIWDWNGTLVDDAWVCVEILNNILARRGRGPVTLDSYRQQFCFPVIDYYEKIGFDFSVDSFEDIAADYVAQYDIMRFKCDLHRGASAALDAFDKADLSQSILSAYHEPKLEEVVNYYDISRFFVRLAGLDNFYANGKIDRGISLIDELGFDPKQVLLIGDTLHDLEVANALGTDCVLVAGGHHSRDKLAKSNAVVLDSLEQLTY